MNGAVSLGMEPFELAPEPNIILIRTSVACSYY
jgi:hypothetical protein